MDPGGRTQPREREGSPPLNEDAVFDECRRMSFDDLDVKLPTLSSRRLRLSFSVGARGFEPLTFRVKEAGSNGVTSNFTAHVASPLSQQFRLVRPDSVGSLTWR